MQSVGLTYMLSAAPSINPRNGVFVQTPFMPRVLAEVITLTSQVSTSGRQRSAWSSAGQQRIRLSTAGRSDRASLDFNRDLNARLHLALMNECHCNLCL